MGNAAKKLLERMRATPNGWSEVDFGRLYVGFGFDYKPGKKHNLAIHPRYPDLITTVPRHNRLLPVYARIAVDLIDRLLEREKSNGTS